MAEASGRALTVTTTTREAPKPGSTRSSPGYGRADSHDDRFRRVVPTLDAECDLVARVQRQLGHFRAKLFHVGDFGVIHACDDIPALEARFVHGAARPKLLDVGFAVEG